MKQPTSTALLFPNFNSSGLIWVGDVKALGLVSHARPTHPFFTSRLCDILGVRLFAYTPSPPTHTHTHTHTPQMKTTMQRMGLPTDNMEMVGSLVSFEEFIRFFIAGVKQTASRCASDPMLQPLSSTDKPEDAKDTSSLSSTGSAISTLATSIFSKVRLFIFSDSFFRVGTDGSIAQQTGTPLGESKSSMQGQNRFKVCF